jgi:hypothetical protein
MMSPRSPRLQPRLAAGIAALVALLLVAGACAGARNSLGTAASPCYRALPGALEAVHHKGHLVGVRRVNTSTLQRRLPGDQQLAAVKDRQLCVFAFHDDFHAGEVTGATNQAQGPYAIVALTLRNPKVVASAIVDRLPTRFRHFR